MKTDIAKLLEKIKSVRIAVYGDFCLDAYWHMDPEGSEVSVETGQQAEAVSKHYYSPGGAANVVANIAALQPKSLKAIGVLGDDIHGRELEAQLLAMGVNTEGMLIQSQNFDTYTFTKKYLGDEEISRTDFGVNNQRSKEIDDKILEKIRLVLEQGEVLVFNQQVPGSITNPAFIEGANQLFETFSNSIILLDSRHYTHLFKQVSLKLNEIELVKLNGGSANYQDHISLADIERHAAEVYQRYHKPIFITCGNRGIISIDSHGIKKIPGLQILSKVDTVGAGDTTLSALSLCLGAGYSSAEASEFANLAAGVSIQKLFTTGTASGEEILALSQNTNFIYQPELAQSPQLARYLGETEIELCYSKVASNLGNIKQAVFDHDGTISTLREGWENIMEPVMIKAILGEQYASAEVSLYQKVRKRVVEYIHKSTGIQTIVQMEALAHMVDEFHIVPKDQILDKFGYKQMYNNRLLEIVNKRISKFRKGERGVEDFTIKGAIHFLRALKDKGIKLYLFSGTDQDDVIREAQLLGYASLFDGGIYGSVGNVDKYSKKIVLKKIIRGHNLKGTELVVFGDGPVEIMECRKVGGIAVGIASDEPRRYGLNVEKRQRLIQSGAHIIVPDFSQGKKLGSFLLKEEKI